MTRAPMTTQCMLMRCTAPRTSVFMRYHRYQSTMAETAVQHSLSLTRPLTPQPSPSILNHPRTRPSNITPDIAAKVGHDLHCQPHHPISLIKQRISSYFSEPSTDVAYKVFDRLPSRVTTVANFDSLLIPVTHPSRSHSDTFYYNDSEVLRTHTSAHQTQFLSSGEQAFLVCGDCYRRDEIDATHYPVFHQMEGVRLWSRNDTSVNTVSGVINHLQQTLNGLIDHLFGPTINRRWLDDTFPFTHPSLQVEIEFNGKWLEILGCGVIQPQICLSYKHRDSQSVSGSGSEPTVHGWAFGLGIERLAMILFEIPDIRLFWSQDPRFLTQFADCHRDIGSAHWRPIKFQPFSRYPECYKDLSFWIDASSESVHGQYHYNDLSAIIREVAGDLVESVTLIDSFTHPKTQRASHAYRINYRSMTQSLTNEQVNAIHTSVREQITQRLPITLR